MPGIGEEMDAAMQQAAQPFRQSIDTSPSSFVCFLYGNIVGEKRKEKNVRLHKQRRKAELLDA
jgi:hypothetical protein